MAGYFEFSKSNNAIAAEADGKFSATSLARRIGVKPAAIKALLSPCEWHHTSKHYNLTDYYSEAEAEEKIDALKAWQPPDQDAQVFEGCTGSYLEWSGTRNHPHAREIKFGPIRVTLRGQWFTLHLSPSDSIRKGKETRGFHLFDAAGKPLTFNRR